MVKRNVRVQFTDAERVIPTAPLYAGVIGEHLATEMTIMLENGRYRVGDTLRLSFQTEDNRVILSDILSDFTTVGDAAYIRYVLPQMLTMSRELEMRVVLSCVEDNRREEVRYRSPAVRLYFEPAETSHDARFWEDICERIAHGVADPSR